MAEPRPHIVNNAWGGGSGSTWFDPLVAAWKEAGIIPVFASGGSGPSCSSIGSPGDHSDVIAVGRTNPNDELVLGSGRGPSFAGQIKPDLVAPALNIVSGR